MGKSNKANRTKGNTRPSSSEHSAQLLSSSGKSFSGFIGFDSLEKDVPSCIPVTGQHSSDTSDLSVDSDLRMVMRKMLKRDSVTRLKAVQEFGDLCAEKGKDSVKNVLPFWPRLFNKLALDYDRRVREATHQANGKLISNVKREIAPYLKNIMGVWLLGQNDLHAPAASAAQTSFTDTFPKAKQTEALMYCKNEIFAYFRDNLFEQTAKTMSDPNCTTAEDIENRYTLVISATLQALKLFLVMVSSNEISGIQDDYFTIISENKFWKLAKNKEPQIRGSWYALISSLCHVKPDLFGTVEKKLVSTVFGSLSESDRIVAPSVWESALHIVVKFDNCWQGMNIQKVVLPQLWTMLNEAGRGNACVLYPCILPFLTKFPREVITKESFLLQFFTCLKQSLLLESVRLEELEAILTTFMECLLYICFSILDSTKERCALIEKVFSGHILPLLETTFYDKKYEHLAYNTNFYSFVTVLIQRLENECLNIVEEVSSIFSHSLNMFWDSMYKIFCKLFDKERNEDASSSQTINVFFLKLFHSIPVISAKGKITFENVSVNDEPHLVPSVDLYKKMPLTFKHMIKFIKILCDKTDENLHYLTLLHSIFASTLNSEFFKDILKSYEESFDSSITFFNKIIHKWITAKDLNYVCLCSLNEIVYHICTSVSEDEALDMLNICCKAKNPILLGLILKRADEVHHDVPFMQKWLKSSTLAEFIVNTLKEKMFLVKDEVEEDNSDFKDYLSILGQAVTNENLLETLNANRSLEEILFLCKVLAEKGLKCENVDVIILAYCDLIRVILCNCEMCWSYSITDDLLSLFFHWILNADKYEISGTTCKEISALWYYAVLCYFGTYKHNAVTRKDGFVLRAAKELNSSLCNLLTSKQASKTFHEILLFLRTFEEYLLDLPEVSTTFVLSELFENILPSNLQWNKLREGLVFSLIPSFLRRTIIYPFPEENICKVSQEELSQIFLAAKVIAQVFTEEIDRCTPSEEEQYFEQYIVKHVPDLFWCLSYCSGNGFMNKDFDKRNYDVLDRHYYEILNFLSWEKVKDIVKDVFYSSLSKGLYWALPFQTLLNGTKTLYPESINLFSDLISEAVMMESDYVSLNVQILSHYILKEKKVFYLKNLLGDLTEKCISSQKRINDDYLRKLGEICCFIRDPEAQDDEVKNLLAVFLNKVMIYDCPKNMEFLFSFQITSLVSSIGQCSPHLVTEEIWNYLLTVLSSNIKYGKSVEFDKPEDILLLFQVSLLYSTLFSVISACKDIEMSWTPTVSEELNESFISLFIHIGGIKEFNRLPAFEQALVVLSSAVDCIPRNILFNYVMQPSIAAYESNQKDKLSTPFESLSSMVLSDIHHLQIIAHRTITKILPLLPAALSNITKSESDDNEDEEEKVPSMLLPLVNTLNILNELMESMLSETKIGECCLVLPNTEPYTFVTAYLFGWIQMLIFIAASPSQVRCSYVTHLEETKLLSSMFLNICRLMPENPMTCYKKDSDSDSPQKECLLKLFLYAPEISFGNSTPEEIQAIACYTFCTALRKVPASLRIWWNNLDKKSAEIINKFTSKYISGILYTEEIRAVHENENLFQNMVVKARLGSREVIATYTVDDFAIELCVQLPTNYPLGPIIAEKRGKIIIAQQEWRHWLMQLTTVLNYQNGSILDGLNIWKKNLDKKFEGVEECMICYYILHNSSLKLPRLSCHTCRKKFHSTCLYKWFHSINNTKCPLCRNEFII